MTLVLGWLAATVVAWREDGRPPAVVPAVIAAVVGIVSGRALFRIWRYRRRNQTTAAVGRLFWDRIQRLDPKAAYENHDSRTRYIRTTHKTPIGQLDDLDVSDLDLDYAAENEAEQTGQATKTARIYKIGTADMVVTCEVRAYRLDRSTYTYTRVDADLPLWRQFLRAMRGERRAAKLGLLTATEDEIRALIEDLDGAEEFGR
ncbi:hypothetical protein I0C86_41075 [Plantactinospora sp. S1510]|uniref:Uncharacterized protein n=1 Tax=Plantactinospora alkalitolerans TaxID=2789879 RepID=A0ABS0H9T9_9ACTN|nr:hypothetical protein [Plantactinospora alkalitolerans]MBF9135245.1 hypothetical protein [Plantactinospora alkalitolerans]